MTGIATNTTSGVRIGDIVVGERARKDIGDVADLVESIRSMGLIHPIVVTRDNELLAGQRRVAACRQLDWEAIPASVAENITDAVGRLAVERDENTCRKDMTWSELADLGTRIETLTGGPKDQAKQRQREHGGTAPGRPGNTYGREIVSVSPAETSKNTAAGEIADALGTSRASMQRAQIITNAARGTYQNQPISQQAQQVAAEALDEMNTTGKVTPAWKKVRAAVADETQPPASKTTASGGPKPSVATKAPTTAKKQRDIIPRAATQLAGMTYGLSQITELAPEITAGEAHQWEQDLARGVAEMNKFRRLLKERSNASE